MPILFLCVIWGAFHTPLPALFTIRFPLPFSSFYFSASLAESKPRQSSLEAFCLPWKGRWVAAGKPEGFHRNLRNLKRMCVTFNPLLPPLKREVGCRRQAGGISKEFTEFKKNVRDLLIRFLPPLKREVGCRRQAGGILRSYMEFK